MIPPNFDQYNTKPPDLTTGKDALHKPSTDGIGPTFAPFPSEAPPSAEPAQEQANTATPTDADYRRAEQGGNSGQMDELIRQLGNLSRAMEAMKESRSEAPKGADDLAGAIKQFLEKIEGKGEAKPAEEARAPDARPDQPATPARRLFEEVRTTPPSADVPRDQTAPLQSKPQPDPDAPRSFVRTPTQEGPSAQAIDFKPLADVFERVGQSIVDAVKSQDRAAAQPEPGGEAEGFQADPSPAAGQPTQTPQRPQVATSAADVLGVPKAESGSESSVRSDSARPQPSGEGATGGSDRIESVMGQLLDEQRQARASLAELAALHQGTNSLLRELIVSVEQSGSSRSSSSTFG